MSTPGEEDAKGGEAFGDVVDAAATKAQPPRGSAARAVDATAPSTPETDDDEPINQGQRSERGDHPGWAPLPMLLVVAAASAAHWPLWRSLACGPGQGDVEDTGVNVDGGDDVVASAGGWGWLWSLDDDGNFVDSTMLAGGGSVLRFWTQAEISVYEPLTLMAKAALFYVTGIHPLAIRLAGTVAHAASSVLLWRCCLHVLRLLGGTKVNADGSSATWCAAAAAGIFAAHPLCVEVVGWPSAVPYTFAGFFCHASVLFYLHEASVVDVGATGDVEGARRAWPVLITGSLVPCGICYACAVLCKSAALPLPLALVALDLGVCGSSGSGPPRSPHVLRFLQKSCVSKLPLVALACALCVPTVLANASSQGRTQVDLLTLSGSERLVKSMLQPWLLAVKALIPTGLKPQYRLVECQLSVLDTLLGGAIAAPGSATAGSDAMAAAGGDCAFPEGVLAIIATIVCGVLAWVKWPHNASVVGAVGYALVMMSPTLGFVQHGSVVAASDRYAYLPLGAAVPVLAAWLLGVCREMSGAGAVTTRRTSRTSQSRPRFACGFAAALVIAVLALLSGQQMLRWRTNHTLWEYSLRVDPADWRGHALYSEILVREGNVELARRHMRLELSALRECRPSAKVALERGKIQHLLGDPDGACLEYEQAAGRWPEFGELLSNVGICRLREGRSDEARALFDRAAELLPDNPRVLSNVEEFDTWQSTGVFNGVLHW